LERPDALQRLCAPVGLPVAIASNAAGSSGTPSPSLPKKSPANANDSAMPITKGK
jgi:hypothetical protein